MVISSPHCLAKMAEYDQINCVAKDSHLGTMLLIEISSFQIFHNFQEDCFKFHDPIYHFLEASYLASPFANNKFQYFFKLAKIDDTDEGAFKRSFQGLFSCDFQWKGNNANCLKVVTMTYLSIDRQDLQVFVKFIQAFIFYIAHY